MAFNHDNENESLLTVVRASLDIASVGALAGWFVAALPAIATGLTVVWTLIRIYETRTVQRWLGRTK